MENIFAGMPEWFHNYDVLLLSSSNGEPLRFAPGSHVGNRRFLVLLSIFRQRYMQASMFGHEDECLGIAQEVVDTVCNKCEPHGRFFQKGRDNHWYRQLRQDSLSSIVANALKNEPAESDCFERSPKRICRRASRFELLHKAAQKKALATDRFVASPAPFDVVCEVNKLGHLSLAQDQHHTGNNRLKILFDIRKKSYETSKQEGKRRIVEEVVNSIIEDSSSHFLQVDKPSGMYRRISREFATTCVERALDVATDGEERRFRQAEIKKLVQRKHKKAVLDKFEKRKRLSCSVSLFSTFLPPTSFNKFRGFVSQAA